MGFFKRSTVLWALGFTALSAVVAVGAVRELYPPLLPETRAITVTATPAAFDPTEPDAIHFGRMRWIGGLVLKSDSPFFGGYSGLSLNRSGTHLFAISDTGTWLDADLSIQDGRLAGLVNARVGPILDGKGAPLIGKRNQDAEGLAAQTPGADDGAYFISFEHDHRIVRYQFANGALSAGEAVALPPAIRALPNNDGLEGIAVLRAGPWQGAILTFAESKQVRPDETIGWLIKDGQARELRLEVTEGFSVTDLAPLANGDVLVLQRRFHNPWDGIHMRLVRIAGGDIKPGALVKPEILLEADGRRTIDNMEGLAVVERPGGEVIVTMISDNNFNPLQRTVLLQFALEAGGKQAD
jgi:hypothetical protein